MNLNKLFEIQAVLDNRIVEEHNLQGVDLLDKKILALQVELGELANEWRGFKFWKVDNEPRTSIYVLKKEYQHLHITQTGMWDYQLRDEFGKIVFDDVTDHHHDHKNPLLEEYVDCLHFILSIGLEINKTNPINSIILYHILEDSSTDKDFIVGTFSQVFKNTWNVHADYSFLFTEFLKLGISLDFTFEQIEQAYYDKNKINHERQSNGY